jgi:hypothetical protein
MGIYLCPLHHGLNSEVYIRIQVSLRQYLRLLVCVITLWLPLVACVGIVGHVVFFSPFLTHLRALLPDMFSLPPPPLPLTHAVL